MMSSCPLPTCKAFHFLALLNNPKPNPFKEGETEKELVQRLNTELLQGQMRLRVKVVLVTRQYLATAWAFASVVGACPSAVLLKFTTSKDHQVVL
ncbi:unnamed protein product [Sphagnum balticum]